MAEVRSGRRILVGFVLMFGFGLRRYGNSCEKDIDQSIIRDAPITEFRLRGVTCVVQLLRWG